MRRILAGVATVLMLAACGSPPGEEPAGTPDATTPEPGESTSQPDPTSSAPADDTDPEAGGSEPVPENVRAAVEDLAGRLSVSDDEITPGPLEEVTWPNGAIGCPAPGQAYTQALVEGYRVILTHDGEEYAYHADEGGELFYCADPGAPVVGRHETS